MRLWVLIFLILSAAYIDQGQPTSPGFRKLIKRIFGRSSQQSSTENSNQTSSNITSQSLLLRNISQSLEVPSTNITPQALQSLQVPSNLTFHSLQSFDGPTNLITFTTSTPVLLTTPRPLFSESSVTPLQSFKVPTNRTFQSFQSFDAPANLITFTTTTPFPLPLTSSRPLSSGLSVIPPPRTPRVVSPLISGPSITNQTFEKFALNSMLAVPLQDSSSSSSTIPKVIDVSTSTSPTLLRNPSTSPPEVLHVWRDTSFLISWREGRNSFTWDQANSFCKGNGMKMISLKNPGKSEHFLTLLQSDRVDAFWAGARLSPDKKKMTWENGRREVISKGRHPWSFTGTRGPQPDGQGGTENCLAVLNNFYNDGVKYHDVGCSHTKPTICEA